MAEKEGFEPATHFQRIPPFGGRCLRALSHHFRNSFAVFPSCWLRANAGQRSAANTKNRMRSGVVSQHSHASLCQVRNQPFVESWNYFLPSYCGTGIKRLLLFTCQTRALM